VRIPLGTPAAMRYGAPYWVIHRGDLQAVLAAAVKAHHDVDLQLGARVDDYAVHPNGITVLTWRGQRTQNEHGIALIGADGLWSTVRERILPDGPPQFAQRTAWRATVPTEALAAQYRTPLVHLWLGNDAHLVHYPVKAGKLVNIVAIIDDRWNKPGWSEPASSGDLLARLSRHAWCGPARVILGTPDRWQKWALYDRPPTSRWSKGPVTLIGDAAHPMLPFVAQGAAMAIEDAAVLAECFSWTPDGPDYAMRTYEGMRRARTAKVQRTARQTGSLYHQRGPAAMLRNLVMEAMGGKRLLARYDWLYDWRMTMGAYRHTPKESDVLKVMSEDGGWTTQDRGRKK
jgi:salicylate hydroxylase